MFSFAAMTRDHFRLCSSYTKEILLIPSAFSMPTGEAHWELLMRTRAVECQCYVIAAAQAARPLFASCMEWSLLGHANTSQIAETCDQTEN